MLNQTTRSVLVSLGQINQSQIISYPVTVIKMGKSIQAFLDVSKPAPQDKEDEAKGCGEEPFDEFAVYQISELNGAINLVGDPEITNNNGVLNIKGSDRSTTYTTTSIDIIEGESRGNPEMIQRVKDPERNTKVLTFDITAKDLDSIKKASTILKDLSDLIICTEGDKVKVSVTSKEKSSNSYDISFNGDVTEETKITLIMDNVSKLPASDYNVQIYKSQKGSLIAVFESKNIDGLDIILSSKAN